MNSFAAALLALFTVAYMGKVEARGCCGRCETACYCAYTWEAVTCRIYRFTSGCTCEESWSSCYSCTPSRQDVVDVLFAASDQSACAIRSTRTSVFLASSATQWSIDALPNEPMFEALQLALERDAAVLAAPNKSRSAVTAGSLPKFDRSSYAKFGAENVALAFVTSYSLIRFFEDGVTPMTVVVEDRRTRHFDVSIDSPDGLLANRREQRPEEHQPGQPASRSIRFHPSITVEPDRSIRVSLQTRDPEVISRTGGQTRTIVFVLGHDGAYHFQRVE